MAESAIKIENLKKRYRLGAIGGQTLNAELQSWWARKRGKEDPNLKLGETYDGTNKEFWALKGINLEVKKGEAVGIIGGNGAGKSTLLKILSRVTAPTEGDIWINGRISSMLEVGTGFHGELTGRENIYMNGAILGMSKKEVDAKMESIIDFSECREFIDTPVKRYSSGMYVKLAFAVASHLDAEIMIMDEVLAVGDMKFQKKCLGKMGDSAANEGKTVLYVSHNMDTIRELCTRCVVLNKGEIVYDGDVEQAIDIYLNNAQQELVNKYDLTQFNRVYYEFGKKAFINEIEFLNKTKASYKNDEPIKVRINWRAEVDISMKMIVAVKGHDMKGIGIFDCKNIVNVDAGKTVDTFFDIDMKGLLPGFYYIYFEMFEENEWGNAEVDESMPIVIEITEGDEPKFKPWPRHFWGSVQLGDYSIRNEE